MNKPLPAAPEDDLLRSFDALTLAGEKPPVTTPKKVGLIGRFSALTLAVKKRLKEDDQVSGLNAQSLMGKKPPAPGKELPDAPPPSGRPSSQHTFVGGFNPGLLTPNIEPLSPSQHFANQHARTADPPSRAKAPTELPPIPMPVPMQSLTMQYALQPDTPAKHMPTPALPIPPPQPDSGSTPSPKATSKPRLYDVSTAPLRPAHPVTPNRQRSASVPPSLVASSPGGDKVQCSGIIKAGRQCSRTVKLPATHYHLDPIPVLFCFQHKPAIDTAPGFYVQKAGIQGKFVEFSHYIPEYLQKDTQLALKVEMEKPTSTSDRPGYIYAFEIRDPGRPDVIRLKVGRAVKLTKRLDQWDKQCGSKVNIPRGWWPGAVGDHDGAGASLLKGNIRAGDPGPFCHRVERLVHIELTDLSLHAPYLNSSWPNMSDQPSALPVFRKTRPTGPRDTACVDCGVIHREIFAFPRPEGGSYQGKEWDLIVKPVIEKWGRFVKEYYA